ncbi:MAG: hypothetical protein II306_08540, partial [Clostridia bacterium]|nr:hypothetical protein [Clostridia bacterium]
MAKKQSKISEFKQTITKLYKKKKTTFAVAFAFLLLIIFGVYAFLMQIANNQIVDSEQYRNEQKSHSVENALYEISNIASYYSEEILLSNPSNDIDRYNEEENVRKSLKAFFVVYPSISFINYSTDT